MNCTVTVSLIYIKNYSRQMHLHKNLPFHSDSLSPTQPLPSRQPPTGGPRKGNHRKGTFKETAPLIFPTTSSGLGRYQLIPPSVKVACVSFSKPNQENVCFSGAWITRPRNPSYQLILIKDSYQRGNG